MNDLLFDYDFPAKSTISNHAACVQVADIILDALKRQKECVIDTEIKMYFLKGFGVKSTTIEYMCSNKSSNGTTSRLK